MSETIDAYIYVSGVDQLADELASRKADIVEGPVNTFYGLRELLVPDCNGLAIAFGHDEIVKTVSGS